MGGGPRRPGQNPHAGRRHDAARAPGTIVGTRLRLGGLGLPGADGARGDLYANVSVQTPSTVSEEERPLWEQLARASAFNPRIKP